MVAVAPLRTTARHFSIFSIEFLREGRHTRIFRIHKHSGRLPSTTTTTTKVKRDRSSRPFQLHTNTRSSSTMAENSFLFPLASTEPSIDDDFVFELGFDGESDGKKSAR